jgi:hypothetical protein
MEFSFIHTYTRAYVSHSSAATGVMCEPTDIAVGSTHYLRHIVLAVHVGMTSCHPYKFHRCLCHRHSCSYGLFGQPRLNTPCLGWNWRLFCHGFLNKFRCAAKYSICSIPPFLQSFILHDTDWPVLSSTNSESRSKVPTCALVIAVEAEWEQPPC